MRTLLTMQKIAVTIIFILGFNATAVATVVWPALYTETKLSSFPIIALSLGIEYVVIRCLFQTNWKKTAAYTVIANLISGVLGLFLRPLSGMRGNCL